MFGQVTAMDLTLLVTGLTFVVVGLWYLRANRSTRGTCQSQVPALGESKSGGGKGLAETSVFAATRTFRQA